MAAQRPRHDRSQPVANLLGADKGSDRSRQRCGPGRPASGPSHSQNPCTHSDETETANPGSTRSAPNISAHAPRQHRLLARSHGPTPHTHHPHTQPAPPNAPASLANPFGDKTPCRRCQPAKTTPQALAELPWRGASTAPLRAQPEAAPHFSANVWTVIALCSLLVLCPHDGLVLAWFGVVVMGWFGLRLLLWFLVLSCICSDCMGFLASTQIASACLPVLLAFRPWRLGCRRCSSSRPEGLQGRLRMPLSPSMPPMSGSSQIPTGRGAAADRLAVQRDSAAATSPRSGCDRLRPVGRAKMWP